MTDKDKTMLEALHEQAELDVVEDPPFPSRRFVIEENAYGPGTHSVQFPDGTPVGVWLAEKYPRHSSEEVFSILVKLGLPEPHALDFARRRAIRDSETEALAAVIGTEGNWAQFVQMESERSKKLEPLRKAYLEAQKKRSTDKEKK